MLIRQNRRGINNMPMLYYLPFIIMSGMFRVATESAYATAKSAQNEKKT